MAGGEGWSSEWIMPRSLWNATAPMLAAINPKLKPTFRTGKVYGKGRGTTSLSMVHEESVMAGFKVGIGRAIRF